MNLNLNMPQSQGNGLIHLETFVRPPVKHKSNIHPPLISAYPRSKYLALNGPLCSPASDKLCLSAV